MSIDKAEAKRRTQSVFEMPPTTDATIAAGIGQLGEQERLRVLANLRDREAAVLAIGLAWSDYLDDKETSFTSRLFHNLTLLSAARSKRGGFARIQIKEIAQSHASSSMEAKEGRVNRFLKAVGLRSD